MFNLKSLTLTSVFLLVVANSARAESSLIPDAEFVVFNEDKSLTLLRPYLTYLKSDGRYFFLSDTDPDQTALGFCRLGGYTSVLSGSLQISSLNRHSQPLVRLNANGVILQVQNGEYETPAITSLTCVGPTQNPRQPPIPPTGVRVHLDDIDAQKALKSVGYDFSQGSISWIVKYPDDKYEVISMTGYEEWIKGMYSQIYKVTFSLHIVDNKNKTLRYVGKVDLPKSGIHGHVAIKENNTEITSYWADFWGNYKTTRKKLPGH